MRLALIAWGISLMTCAQGARMSQSRAGRSKQELEGNERNLLEKRARRSTPGDPIQTVVTPGNLLSRAIENNMFAITGGYSKGKGGVPQELAYRMEPAGGAYDDENAYAPSLGILAYFAKPDGSELPVKEKPGRNLPDMSASYVKAFGTSVDHFGIKALEGQVDLTLSVSEIKKASGQPWVKMASKQIKEYGTGNSVDECYLMFIHNHEISYGTIASIPTKIQVVGISDAEYVSRMNKNEQQVGLEFFKEAPLCGVCIDLTPNWTHTGVKKTTPNVCPSGSTIEGSFVR